MNLKGKELLITGGTGSLGKEITKYIYKYHKEIPRIYIKNYSDICNSTNIK